MTNKSEIDALVRAEVERQLKAAQPTPYPDEAAVARHRDEMHQMAERRASAFNPFTRDQLAAMRAAAPDADVKGIVHDQRNAPTGPASIIPGGARSTSVRVSGGTGWGYVPPIKNGLGQGK